MWHREAPTTPIRTLAPSVGLLICPLVNSLRRAVPPLAISAIVIAGCGTSSAPQPTPSVPERQAAATAAGPIVLTNGKVTGTGNGPGSQDLANGCRNVTHIAAAGDHVYFVTSDGIGRNRADGSEVFADCSAYPNLARNSTKATDLAAH